VGALRPRFACYRRGVSANPPAICTGCFADRRAGDGVPCPTCDCSIEEVSWTPFPNGITAWIARGLLAVIPGALGVFMLVGGARLGFGPGDPSLPLAPRMAFAFVATAIGLAMLGVTNLILLARRWDYRSRDGRGTGWVQTLLGRVFEAKGTYDHASVVPAPPAARLDSAVLAEPWCSVPLGLTMTVLGMAARGAIVLHVVERRTLGRPPNWPLCFGWLGARTTPDTSAAGEVVEVAAAPGETERRRLEGALVGHLPPIETIEAPSPDFREAAAVVRAGAPVSLGGLLLDCVANEGGGAAVRELATWDEAATWITDGSGAKRALAACRAANPRLIELIERDAAMAITSQENEAGTDPGS